MIDLCKPSQRKYETAVSIILGRNLDAIIVDTEKTAVECIRYMREQRAGQATFLPLDTLKVKPINEKYRNFVKGSRLAVDVIEIDQQIEIALHFACGNALICDSAEIARSICYEKQQEVKAVSLDGTVIHKTGMITGGQSNSSSNQRWEEKEVDTLKRNRDQWHVELQEISNQLRKVNEDQLKYEITGLQMRLDSISESMVWFFTI
jgi:structural maintenance of chromosome 1